MSFNNNSIVGGYSGSKGSFNASPVTFSIGNSSVTPNISHSNNGFTPYRNSIYQSGSILGGGVSISTPINSNTNFNVSGHAHGADKNITFSVVHKF